MNAAVPAVRKAPASVSGSTCNRSLSDEACFPFFRIGRVEALNLLPSMAMLALVNRSISRQRKRAHTLRIAGPLFLRKSTIASADRAHH